VRKEQSDDGIGDTFVSVLQSRVEFPNVIHATFRPVKLAASHAAQLVDLFDAVWCVAQCRQPGAKFVCPDLGFGTQPGW
jgi:hypothetical protein